MTKDVISVQFQIDGLKNAISDVLDGKVVDLTVLSELETRMKNLEKVLEFLLDSNDRSE